MSRQKPDIDALSQYLSCRNKDDRLKQLAALKEQNQNIPLELGDDLLCLDFSGIEKSQILNLIASNAPLKFEMFLVDKIIHSDQDLAVAALQRWLLDSPKLLWFVIAGFARSSHVPQRLLYRIVDAAHALGADMLLSHVVTLPGVSDFSPAFHGILLHRSSQLGFTHENLTELAVTALQQIDSSYDRGYEKTLPGAVNYLARFDIETLTDIIHSRMPTSPWHSIIHSISLNHEQTPLAFERLEKQLNQTHGELDYQTLTQIWPPLWQRSLITDVILSKVISKSSSTVFDLSDAQRREFFSGIPPATFIQALEIAKDDETIITGLRAFSSVWPTLIPNSLLKLAKTRIESSKDPAKFLTGLREPLRTHLLAQNADGGGKPEWYDKIAELQEQTLKQLSSGKSIDSAKVLEQVPTQPREASARSSFFDLAYRKKPVGKELNGEESKFFNLLINAWEKPRPEILDDLSTEARKAPGLFQICYLNTLGKFKKSDKAVLKLLDFMRSNEELEIKAVMHALHGISSPRSSIELVNSLTRPNVPIQIQMEIAQYLKDQDTTTLQSEIRSAIRDLNPNPESLNAFADLKENLEALLHPDANSPKQEIIAKTTKSAPHVVKSEVTLLSDSALDEWLSTRISTYEKLSSEVKRSLRTARFFHAQVTGSENLNAIDLSPMIDMQYKALELFFRELFEDPCREVIETGILQRKLDIIGYARPIEQQMSQFENFISNLPTINSIPFFSKFKLRKMLRAICQFRPGRRFTLDGIKAFGLFFLVFSRKEDRYGLANLFPVHFSTDQDLYKFCRTLHIFQDTRNRAAHEGFQPDAGKDIDAVWSWTSEIIETAFAVHESLNSINPKNKHQTQRSEYQNVVQPTSKPIIVQKKVS